MNGNAKKIFSKKSILIAGGAALIAAIVLLAILLPRCGSGKEVPPVDKTAEATAAADTPTPTESPTPELTAEPDPTPTPGPEIIDRTPPFGMVAVSDKLTYGVSTVGLLSYTGVTNGRGDCYNWRDVVFVVTNERFTAGLTKDGRVLVAGDSTIAERTAGWTGVTEICCMDTAVYGLKADGTLLSTNNTFANAENIVAMAACGNYFIAVDAQGGFIALGTVPDYSSLFGKKIVRLAAGTEHIVGLTPDGTLFSTREGDPFNGAAGGVRAFAGDGCTAYIDTEGCLHTDCALLSEDGGAEITDLPGGVWFASCADHAVLLNADGTVAAFGSSDHIQCAVDNWRLRPYITESGYIFGIAPGKPGSRDVIRTGDAYTLPDGTEGIAVVLGDVNCDGGITQADLDLLRSYVRGDTKFSAAQKQAANILRQPSRPDTIDSADVEQLRCHLLGYTVIDQYAKNFTYLEKIVNAERTNTDACGYISIRGTNIDAPIMYGDDFYYHYHNPTGAADSKGSLYLYYNYPSQNTVITGHNLRSSGTMLHDLHKIQDKYASGFGQYKNRLWTINLFGETGVYEVFAMYEEKPSDPSKSSQYYNCNYNFTMEHMAREQIELWIARQIQRTELRYTVTVTADDRFVTILTCSDTHAESERGGRIYFFLRRVDGH